MNLLPISKKIVSYAPKLEDWDFYYAKQVKEWKGYFEVNVNGTMRPIVISDWQYVLLEYEDQMFEIVVKPNPYPNELEEEIAGIVEMVLDSIIGEEYRIEKLNFIDVVRIFPQELVYKSTLIAHLKNQISGLDNSSQL